MAVRFALLVAASSCSDPYVHVIVEGSDLELVVAPTDVSVAVYRDGGRTAFDYVAPLEPGRLGDLPATDFVLTGELTNPAQLRVTIPTATNTWLAEATLDDATGSELRLPLSAGERAVGTAAVELGTAGADTSVLFGSGIALAWVDDTQGLLAWVVRDPDMLFGRTTLVEADRDATNVRLASRPDPVGFGPDLYAIGWLSSTREARLRVTSAGVDRPIVSLVPGTAVSELRLGAAFKNAAFGVAIAVRIGSSIRLATVSALGEPIASATLGTGVELLSGVVVTSDGNIIVAWRGADGSHLVLVDGDLSGGANVLIDQRLPDDLLAIALSPDGGRLQTILGRGTKLANVSYFVTNLQPTGVDVLLGTTISGGEVSVSGCVVAWPEQRADSSGAIDLRYALLDADGALDGKTHLLNASDAGDHIRPTTVCASRTRAYVTFIERSLPGDRTGRLRIRRIPAIDQ